MKNVLKLHLALGLFCLPFLLVYAADGVRCGHPKWFSTGGTEKEYRRTVESPSVDLLVGELGREYDMLGTVSTTSEGFRVDGPLKSYVVDFDSERREAVVKETTRGLMGSAHNLHATIGVHHDNFPMNAWGVAAIVVSLGLIALGLTGLWLWLPRLKERRLGLVFLVCSVGYALVCLVLIQAA